MLIKMINENDILALTRTHTYTHRTHGQDTSNYHFHSDPKQSETIITNSHCQNTYMQHAHYTHTCVNKVYSKCFGIFAYVHEPVCMRCIQNYSVDSFVSTAANKLCWILGFGWMLFFHSASLCDLINSSSVYRGTYFLFVPAVYFCCFEWVVIKSNPKHSNHSFIHSALYFCCCCCCCCRV